MEIISIKKLYVNFKSDSILNEIFELVEESINDDVNIAYAGHIIIICTTFSSFTNKKMSINLLVNLW